MCLHVYPDGTICIYLVIMSYGPSAAMLSMPWLPATNLTIWNKACCLEFVLKGMRDASRPGKT